MNPRPLAGEREVIGYCSLDGKKDIAMNNRCISTISRENRRLSADFKPIPSYPRLKVATKMTQ